MRSKEDALGTDLVVVQPVTLFKACALLGAWVLWRGMGVAWGKWAFACGSRAAGGV